jgi:hypothetical protein
MVLSHISSFSVKGRTVEVFFHCPATNRQRIRQFFPNSKFSFRYRSDKGP